MGNASDGDRSRRVVGGTRNVLLQRTATSTQTIVAAASLLGLLGIAFWALDSARLPLSRRPAAPFGAGSGAARVRFRDALLYYRERKGTWRKTDGSAAATGEPLEFSDMPSPGLLRSEQRQMLKRLIVEELGRRALLTGPQDAAPVGSEPAGTLRMYVTVTELPDGLLLCRIVDAPGLPAAAISNPALQAEFPSTFLTSRPLLFRDLTRAIQVDLRAIADALSPEGTSAGARP